VSLFFLVILSEEKDLLWGFSGGSGFFVAALLRMTRPPALLRMTDG
jgi:hypothetical protein